MRMYAWHKACTIKGAWGWTSALCPTDIPWTGCVVPSVGRCVVRGPGASVQLTSKQEKVEACNLPDYITDGPQRLPSDPCIC